MGLLLGVDEIVELKFGCFMDRTKYEVVIFPNTGKIVVCDLGLKKVKEGRIYAFSVDRKIMRYFSTDIWANSIKIYDGRVNYAIKKYLEWVKTKGLYDLDYQKNLKEIARKKRIVKSFFSKCNLIGLWHITHRENVPDILKHGLLSHYDARNRRRVKDISDPEAQKWRGRKEPYYNRSIQDYVPLYFNPKNPMLYVRRNMQHCLCIMEISLSVFFGYDYLFTDGNASCKETNFFDSLENLDKLPWDVLTSERWDNYDGGKRKRCAEVLIYPKIEPHYIKNVHCCSEKTLELISKYTCKSKISKSLYF